MSPPFAQLLAKYSRKLQNPVESVQQFFTYL